MIKRILFLAVSFSLLFALIAGAMFYRHVTAPLHIPEDVYLIELKRGESLGHLALKLKADGLLDSTLVFKLYGKLARLDDRLKAGEYLIAEGTSLVGLFHLLESGKTVQRSFTFVEGWSYKELFTALEQDEYLHWVNSPEAINQLRESLTLMGGHLEGMFFADTYFYQKGQDARDLLLRSNRLLHEVLQQEWEQRQDGLPLKTPYEALILASIVEKETAVASERALIAGVFINRLNRKMRLQTDPTVIYGLGERYQGNLTRKHLQEYTEYNTYRIPGLPPSPIAIVGRESIHAALHPQETDYYYFVAKGDGSHYFSPSFEEHQRAVRQYQLRRVENYRSVPDKQ